MKLALAFGIAALTAGLLATTQPRADTVCQQAAQTPNRSPLPYLPECKAVYCGAEADPEIRQGLHDTDIKLGDLNVALSLARISQLKFKRACRAINGDLTITGPRMDEFSAASYDVSVNKGKLADIYDALQEPNDGNVLVKMRSSRMRTSLAPACMARIDKEATDGLKAAQILIEEIQINCEPFVQSRQ